MRVAAPAVVEHLKVSDEQEESSDVMAEAVLAGEEVEEFANGMRRRQFWLLDFAPLAGLAEDLFVGNGPGDTGDGESEHKEDIRTAC